MSSDTPAGSPATRIERDSMGEMEVPGDALYGASTARAILNFPISGIAFSRSFLRAVGLIKAAPASAVTMWTYGRVMAVMLAMDEAMEDTP